MGGAGRIGLLSLLILTAAVYFVITKAYGGDRKAMVEGFRYSAERLGPWAMPVFVLVHTVAIALCFPYAIVFEAAASFLFGFLNGVMCVFAAKIMGASLAFWLGRALFRSSTWASDLVRKNKYFDIINKGVVRDGWKFVFILITWRIRKYAKYASSEDFVLIDASKVPHEREQDGQQQLDTRMSSSDESSEYSQTLHRRSTSQSPSMSQHS